MKQSFFGTDITNPKTPAAAAAPTPEPGTQNGVSREEFNQLASAVNQTNSSVDGLVATLKELATTPADPPTPQPPADLNPDVDPNDQLLDDFTKNPAEVMDARIQQGIREATEQMAPALQQAIDVAHNALMTRHEAQINQTYGQGAWDLIKPGLDEDLGSLRKLNYNALGHEDSMNSIVYRRFGMPESREALAEHQAQNQEPDVPNDPRLIVSPGSIPQGGSPNRITPSSARPDPDTSLFFEELEKATGKSIDKQQFAQLHTAGNTIDDYKKVVGEEQ